jgi:hypothetical protein
MSPTDGLLTPPDPGWNPLGAERDALKQFLTLTRRKRELEREVEEINPKLKALGELLREYLAGFPPVHLDEFSIFLRETLWARKQKWASMATVCAALKANGMADFVKEEFSTSTLSSHVRQLKKLHAERLRSGELAHVGLLLPPEVERLLVIEPTYNVIAQEIGTEDEE